MTSPRTFLPIFSHTCLVMLLWLAVPVPAQLQETIGFELEDYLHAWPQAYPPHSVTLTYPAGESDYPPIRIRYDDRSGYRDLEIHIGPFRLDQLPEGLFTNYLEFYKDIIERARNAEERTLASMYRYKPVKLFTAEEHQYQLAFVTEFLNSNIPNKSQPPNPSSDVGPQATFSLDTRKAYRFFRDAPNNPFFYAHTKDLLHRMDVVDERHGTVDKCLTAPEEEQTVYGCSLRARGFTYFLAMYLANTINKANSLGANGGEIKKESYPLYLRNVAKDINAVKEYFITIAKNDPIIGGAEQRFIGELKKILPRIVPEFSQNTGMDTGEFVGAYLDFLGGSDNTGFRYGPVGDFGVPRYIFSTLGDASDAVITDPNADSVYFEIRNLRNKFVTDMHRNPSTYAVPYDTAMDFAQRAMTYLVEFNQQLNQSPLPQR